MANLYVSIANDLEQKIRNKELKENDKLPSERELTSIYGVSRNVIREALKAMEEKGLVDIKMGKGVFVTKPEVSNVSDTLETFIDTTSISIEQVVEARKELELVVCRLAIERADKEDIQKLSVIYEEMQALLGNPAAFCEKDAEFHVRLAKASQNEMLELFTKTINNVLDRKLVLDSRDGYLVRERAQIEHKAIIMALEYKDMAGIEDAVQRHIHCIMQQLNVK